MLVSRTSVSNGTVQLSVQPRRSFGQSRQMDSGRLKTEPLGIKQHAGVLVCPWVPSWGQCWSQREIRSFVIRFHLLVTMAQSVDETFWGGGAGPVRFRFAMNLRRLWRVSSEPTEVIYPIVQRVAWSESVRLPHTADLQKWLTACHHVTP